MRRLDHAPDGRIAYPIAVAAAASGHGLPLGASLEAFALAQAAWTPGILAQRDHGRQAAAGTVTGKRIRDLPITLDKVL